MRPGDPVYIRQSLLDENLRLLNEYKKVDDEFRCFYFSLGATADTSTPIENETNNVSSMTTQCKNQTIVDGVRRLFKLGKANNLLESLLDGFPLHMARSRHQNSSGM